MHRNKTKEILAHLGLHPGQETLLLFLDTYDGCTQSEMGVLLGIQAPTLTRMLDRMTKNDFLMRQVDPRDQRISRIYLTDRGRNVLVPLQQQLALLETRIQSGLSDDDQQLLRRLLMKLSQNLALPEPD